MSIEYLWSKLNFNRKGESVRKSRCAEVGMMLDNLKKKRNETSDTGDDDESSIKIQKIHQIQDNTLPSHDEGRVAIQRKADDLPAKCLRPEVMYRICWEESMSTEWNLSVHRPALNFTLCSKDRRIFSLSHTWFLRILCGRLKAIAKTLHCSFTLGKSIIDWIFTQHQFLKKTYENQAFNHHFFFVNDSTTMIRYHTE